MRVGILPLFVTTLMLLAQPALARAPSSLERLDAYLEGLYPPDAPGAVVLVARNGKTLFRKAYGLASVEHGTPLTPDAVFYIASVTKTFTAAAILRLVEQGRLSLDDEVTKHLPDYPTQGRRITLRHLLSHTSGIPDYAGMVLPEALTPESLTAIFQDLPLAFSPGEGFSYSNSGYALLGRILEKHSGMSYGDALERQLFQPLGLQRTRYASRTLPGTVSGYVRTHGRYVSVGALDETRPYAAGGLLSTVDDLARWSAALDTGRVLRKRSRAESFRRTRLTDGSTCGYGLGWMLTDEGPYEAQWHGGDIDGFASILYRLPARRLTVVVLSNNAHSERPFFVAPRVAQLVLGEDWTPGRASVPVAAQQAYAGTYRGPGGQTHLVSLEQGRLLLGRAAGSPEELQPLSATEFSVGQPPVRARFVRGRSGAVEALHLVPYVGCDERAARVQAPAR